MKKLLTSCSLFFLLLKQRFFGFEQKIVIIRHGESEHNVKGIFNSDPSHPEYFISSLTSKGCKQIKASVERLKSRSEINNKNTMLIVSPLPRTLQSAAILLEEKIVDTESIIIEERLTEVKCSEELEGQLMADHKNSVWFGESENEVFKRVRAVCNETIGQYQNKHIIFLTHGGPAKQLSLYCQGYAKSLKLGEANIIDRPLL